MLRGVTAQAPTDSYGCWLQPGMQAEEKSGLAPGHLLVRLLNNFEDYWRVDNQKPTKRFFLFFFLFLTAKAQTQYF